MSFALIVILVLVGVMLILGLIGKFADSSNIVVTKAGVRKIHDIECKFRTGSTYHGDLDQGRWSDGQERVEMNLNKLPGAYTGPVRMLHNGRHVSDFDAVDGEIKFVWKGQADPGNPKFEIGDEVRLEFGGHVLAGKVKAD